MLSPREHFAIRFLRALSGAVCRHRPWFIYPQLLLAGVCVWYTAFSPWHLQFDMSRDNLVGGDKKYHQNYLRFKKEFPLQDDLVVVVESEDAEKNRQFVERLGARLERATNLFTDVVYKGDLKLLGQKALLFIPEPELAELHKTLLDYRPFLDQFTRATNLQALLDLANLQFLNARPETNAENEALVKALPAFERILAQAADSIQRGGTPPSPGIDALFNGGQEAEGQMYVTCARGRIYLLTARARAEDLREDAVAQLRTLVLETQREVSGVNAGITGEPVLEIDEMAQSEKDTSVASASCWCSSSSSMATARSAGASRPTSACWWGWPSPWASPPGSSAISTSSPSPSPPSSSGWPLISASTSSRVTRKSWDGVGPSGKRWTRP